MNLAKIQSALTDLHIPAWLLLDFRGSNSIAWNILGLVPDTHCTRRWAVLIPQSGRPTIVSHAIESFTLSHLEGKHITYSRWTEWHEILKEIVAPFSSVAIEYSPMNDIPVVSKVDAGTVELLRSFGITLLSSANLVQTISAVWSVEQLDHNLNVTAPALHTVMAEAQDFLRKNLLENKDFTEYDVQQYIVERFAYHGLISDSEPIVAIGINAASPHYAPTKEKHSPIKIGDIILVDMWAKSTARDSTFSDITWMFYAGEDVPERAASLFSVLAQARDAGIELVRKRFAEQNKICGYEVDDTVRSLIEKAGYGKYFIHRTGHSITTETHGSGTNIDNYETRDSRPIIAGTSFSIEPGIYIHGEIGLRTEIDVVINSNGEVIVPTTYPQQDIVPLLAKNSQ